MGKQSRRKQERRTSSEWQAIRQARQKWLGKVVKLNEQTGYRDAYGKVVGISSSGDVVVESLPGRVNQFAGAVMTLEYLDQMLVIVD